MSEFDLEKVKIASEWMWGLEPSNLQQIAALSYYSFLSFARAIPVDDISICWYGPGFTWNKHDHIFVVGDLRKDAPILLNWILVICKVFELMFLWKLKGLEKHHPWTIGSLVNRSAIWFAGLFLICRTIVFWVHAPAWYCSLNFWERGLTTPFFS